jgi:hypothetical protein
MDKIAELKAVVGRDCSCNQSPTLKAKLISVGKYKCTLEVRPTMYNRNQWSNIYAGKKIILDTATVHNMYFF